MINPKQGQNLITLLPTFASIESDDPDTQIACIIAVPDGRLVIEANSLPTGVLPNDRRTTRPGKYLFIQHAERKAIATAARLGLPLCASTAYLNWFPCVECAGSLIQAGVSTLCANREAYEARKDDPRYYFAEAMEMFNEVGLRIEWF